MIKKLHEIEGFEILASSQNEALQIAENFYNLSKQMNADEINFVTKLIEANPEGLAKIRKYAKNPEEMPMPWKLALKAFGLDVAQLKSFINNFNHT